MRTISYEECPECGRPMQVTATKVLAEKVVIARECHSCGYHGIETAASQSERNQARLA